MNLKLGTCPTLFSLGLAALVASVPACGAPSGSGAAAPRASTPPEGLKGLGVKEAQSTLLPIDADDAVWGSAQAPVTLMAFLDFECHFCRASHPILSELMTKYGPKRLRFVFKHYPLPSHGGGIAAAIAAQAVKDVGGVAAFFVFEDKLYSTPLDEVPDFSKESLATHALAAGVTREKFDAALADPHTRARVGEDIALAERIGVSAVPAFLINGLPLVGAAPPEYFEQLIDSELEAAAEAAKNGIQPQQIYDHRVRFNVQRLTSQGS